MMSQSLEYLMISAYNVYQEMVSEPLEINSVRFPLNLSGGREWQSDKECKLGPSVRWGLCPL